MARGFLITGSGGQLAKAFMARLGTDGAEFTALDKNALDIADPVEIEAAMTSLRPDVIINCAAYNNVDGAEAEKALAFRVNAEGPEHLALAAKKHGARILHFGTDYVFDGQKANGLYVEDDATGPLGNYGFSKLEGERRVISSGADALVLRLSWVYGDGTQNFVHKLKQWAGGGGTLRITCDEFSVPSRATTVVDVSLAAIKAGLTGLYHMTGGGYCSRYEWAREIAECLGLRNFVRPVRSEEFDSPAVRPMFSAMDNGKISSALGASIPHWRDDLRLYLR